MNIKSPKKVLLIGLTAKNEKQTIYDTLSSILKEVTYFKKLFTIKIVIVLNGSTDGTEREIDRFIKNSSFNKTNINVIKAFSSEGKINAQKKILSFRNRSCEAIIFLDADILLGKKSLIHLYNHLINSSAQVVWASVTPFHKSSATFIKKVLNYRDCFPKVFHGRKYLCGRAFIIRNYNVLKIQRSTSRSIDKKIFKLLCLEKGPIVDDMYLTKHIHTVYGIDAIENCSNAIAYYNPISSIIDFYNSQRRTIIETKRLKLLFPMFKNTSPHLKKIINYYEILKLSIVNRIGCYIYIALYSVVRNLAKLELNFKMFLVKVGFNIDPIEIWPCVKTSKIHFR